MFFGLYVCVHLKDKTAEPIGPKYCLDLTSPHIKI